MVSKTKRALRHETTWLRSFLRYERHNVAFDAAAMRDMGDRGVDAVDIQNAYRNARVLSGEPNEGPRGEAVWFVEGRDADDRRICLEPRVEVDARVVRIVRVLPARG
jgi:hypothetical protein